LVLNEFWYLFRRNSWMIDPTWLLQFYHKVTIDRPIFLLGNQGGGLTLISRILRRNHQVVSITGNANYWSGADEMQNVVGPILPRELTGLRHKPYHHPVLTAPRSWSYATDPLIQYYRNTELDYTVDLEKRFKSILKYTLARYSISDSPRFIDKSQVFTVKVSLVNKILHANNPHFILVTRNPYIECPRAASGKAADMKRYRNYIPWEKRLKLATEHWKNSMLAVLDDIKRCNINIYLIRFEDFIRNPGKIINELCHYLDLEFEPKMLPHKEDKIPFGSHYRDRWYPLRSEVNKKYKGKFSDKDYQIVRKTCGDLARFFGYSEPFEITKFDGNLL